MNLSWAGDFRCCRLSDFSPCSRRRKEADFPAQITRLFRLLTSAATAAGHFWRPVSHCKYLDNERTLRVSKHHENEAYNNRLRSDGLYGQHNFDIRRNHA